MEFKQFRDMQQQHVRNMVEGHNMLFVVDVDKDKLWDTYLDAFPPGTNVIFRERREMDCSCCRHFVKEFGGVVAIEGGKLVSAWDFEVDDPKFGPVLKKMSRLVRKAGVRDVFAAETATFGTGQNHEQLEDGSVHTWYHFRVEIPGHFKNVATRQDKPTFMAKYRDIKNVFARSLNEISQDAIETVLEIIAQGSLYRGEEWKGALTKFLAIHKEYSSLPQAQKDNFCWSKSVEVGGAIGKIRNHSIGVLLTDITNGMGLNDAIRKWEKVIVPPSTYKRPKTVYTQRQVDQAMEFVDEHGLRESIARRHATIDDITVNNILFANKDAHNRMEGGNVFDLLKKEAVAVTPKNFDRLEEIPIERFVNDVLPTTTSVEVFVEGKHASNFVSVIAPQNKDAPTMFKWDNGFSWAYNGNIADSMRERVVAAGGRVDGVLRFTHSWNHDGRNQSLMDLHVFMPGCGYGGFTGNDEVHDRYPTGQRVGWNKRTDTSSGGVQDVDYVCPPGTNVPIENITFPTLSRMPEGKYIFKIHNWQERYPNETGFEAEIEFEGNIYQFKHQKPLRNKQWITLAEITLKNGRFTMTEMHDSSSLSYELWGLQTNTFHPVSLVMFSPNYWDEQGGHGNKHYIFVVEGCKNDDSPNGFFNEFLREDFMEHKRVFEALGGKMRVPESNEQLSGLGFSSTKRNSLVVKIKGQTSRMAKLVF